MKAPRPTLLVVDDEPEVLRSVHDLLRHDYDVLTCEHGSAAVAVLDSPRDIHVVMSDQRMPGMTGVDVLRYAQKVRPEATRLMFTAYADLKTIIDAINQGYVFRYIAKPWGPDELETFVRQAVEQNRLIAEKTRLLGELRETNRRLVEADRLKGAFIEVASHELNTPVAVVLGMTQLWKLSQGQSASPAERHWVDRIHHAGKRLATTVERMLKLVRTDEMTHPLELECAPLEPLVREVVAEVGTFLRARGQSVDVTIGPDLGSARIDRAKIGDVLTNLLVNAIKFTPDGGGLRLTATARGQDAVRFEVADQGVGIDPTTLCHLFEPFFTGFDTLHHSSGEFEFGKRGIGLGLCVVKRFVELHGGTVEVRSAPGAGSTFSFTLSRDPDAAKAANGRDGALERDEA